MYVKKERAVGRMDDVCVDEIKPQRPGTRLSIFNCLIF